MTPFSPSLPEVARLARRSDAIGLWRLAQHGAALLLAGAAVVLLRPHWARWPAMALLGVLEVALFAPLHETTHRTPFRSDWLNRAVGWGAGFLLLLPPEWFRLFHMAHHRHTQDARRDPELAGAPSLTRGRYAWVLTGLPYWIANARALWRSAGGRADDAWIPPPRRRAVVREARAYLALYVAAAILMASAAPWLLWLWVVPALLGQPVLRAFLLAEHAGCPRIDDGFANTRTTLAGRLTGWLFWNAHFHAEHHLVPSVPFHALPALHAIVADRLASTAAGYPAAHRQIRASIAAAQTAIPAHQPLDHAHWKL